MARAAQKRGQNSRKSARGERHPLPPRKHVGLCLPRTKLREGCDKLSDLSARGDEFRIISLEDGWFQNISQKDRWFRSISQKGDSYWISAERVIVTGYQPKGAITGDSYWISAERVDGFKASVEG